MSRIIVISRKIALPFLHTTSKYKSKMNYNNVPSVSPYPEIHTDRFISYLKYLTEEVEKSQGFIESENFWSHLGLGFGAQYTAAVTVSKWQTEKDWHNWFKSKERFNIHKNYKDVLESESFEILVKRNPPNDMPLL